MKIKRANTYLSGQGSIYIAKYFGSGVDRTRGDFFDLGNAPHFSISIPDKNVINKKAWTTRSTFFYKEVETIQDSIKIIFECFNENNLDLIFGGPTTVVNAEGLSDIGEFKTRNLTNKIVSTPIVSQSHTRNYSLIFEGFNTADNNKEFRVELNDVHLRPSKRISLINDDLTDFEVTGYYNYHPDDKAYLVVGVMPQTNESTEQLPTKPSPAKRLSTRATKAKKSKR